MSDDVQNTPAPATPGPVPNGDGRLNGQPAAAQPAAAQAPATPPAAQGGGAGAGAQQRLRFNTANIKSTYCNVCNATSTREEVVINFGLNQTWDMGTQDLEVQLEHRIILSPSAAKRLQELLTRLMQEHEQRYGALR